jgi:hypothetical protein
MSSNEDYFEEELRLAEEMSFLDEYDLYWDPANLGETKDRVKMYEDIVDEQLLVTEPSFALNNRPSGIVSKFSVEDDSVPLPDSQIRDLFFSSLDSSEKLGSNDDSVKFSGDNTGRNNIDYSPTLSERRSASKEQKLKETVHSICRSLRWYQSKIVKQIESTSEVSFFFLLFFCTFSDFLFCFIGRKAGSIVRLK